jgi:hypothetical protein
METKTTNRQLKKKILKKLEVDSEDFEKSLEDLKNLPARQAVNPLFSFFFHKDELIRWRSVSAMGAVVSNLFSEDRESARVVMRRLMWNLNDESGGIGWGSPEAMGDIMARSKGLAEEFHSILVSYLKENGNFLEHEILQSGVLWGLGRLASLRPEKVSESLDFIPFFLSSQYAVHRGLSARILGYIGDESTKHLLNPLTNDNAYLILYSDYKLQKRQVNELAMIALNKIDNNRS